MLVVFCYEFLAYHATRLSGEPGILGNSVDATDKVKPPGAEANFPKRISSLI